ncbi:MAG: deoxyhypusine synthase family protein [Nanoarchaeota archaeon]|nr:deoxyhypusine synthase family protein [Nanoarchaeota archaeon]MBU1050942.1 deoxyhypusine synthase family protein [Nanoarchaeota archaeon]MBU1988219.1 deoxyhypusine synthase family protein [Nanoarchaeota archaeon]
MEKVKPIKLEKDMKVSELVGQMKDAGFGARKIGRAAEIVKKMFADEECKVFFGLAGAMVPAGMKQIVIDLIRQKKIDVLVTTGANLTHDLIESLGDEHYHCDSWDDEEFHEKGYDRMYNVLMKNEVYVKLENFFEDNWDALKGEKTIKGFLKKIGELLSEKNSLNDSGEKIFESKQGGESSEGVVGDSILKACYENDVPVYCPALADSGIGLMIWGRKAQGKEIFIDAFEDMKEIIDFAWTAKKIGVVYIGGGTPKNFIQQSLQFSKGADYGVQITQDVEAGGGSSGAGLEEGKSWGKLKVGAREGENFVDVRCDATIAMGLVFSDLG